MDVRLVGVRAVPMWAVGVRAVPMWAVPMWAMVVAAEFGYVADFLVHPEQAEASTVHVALERPLEVPAPVIWRPDFRLVGIGFSSAVTGLTSNAEQTADFTVGSCPVKDV